MVFPVTLRVPSIWVFPASETDRTVDEPASFLMFYAFTLLVTFIIFRVCVGNILLIPIYTVEGVLPYNCIASLMVGVLVKLS